MANAQRRAAQPVASAQRCPHQSGHRSSGARRGVASVNVTMAEVGQGWVLEHPRWRGHPPGKWVEVTAQSSSLSMGGGKTVWRRRSLMRWVLWWPAVSCIVVGKRRKLMRRCTQRKRRQGGARGSAHRGVGGEGRQPASEKNAVTR
jgi:hypothetical protein